MSIFDRLSERVGDFIEEVMLPEEIHALHQQARRAMERGDYEAALQNLGEAEHRRPQTERTRRMRGVCHFYLQNFEKAAELLHQALAIREEAASHFYLGLCEEELQHLNEAKDHFQRALQLDDDPPFAFDLYFGLGRVHLALSRPDRATRELRRALRVWPGQREASLRLAEALWRRDRHDEAAQVLDRDLSDSTEIEVLLLRGRLEASRGHHEDAVTAYEALLEKDPDHLDGLVEAARSYLALHRPGPADQLLLRALGEDGAGGAAIYALIGEANERVKNDARARQSYEAALKRDPDHRRARLGAARVALAQEDIEEAAHHFQHLLTNSADEFRAEALLGLGRCRLRLDDPAGARHLLEQADQLHTERPPELLHGLGAVALASRDPAEALVAFQSALSAEPDTELRALIDDDIHRALQALRPSWRRPDNFESTADLVVALEDLREELRADATLERFLPRVHELMTTLNSPLSLAVLGEFNAGKSTLINAILAEEVVPMGVLPTTAHPCIMGFGPRKGVRIVYADGRRRDADFATARTLMKQEAAEISRLDYTYPHPELRSINYWDTPGFNALDERHEDLARQALHDAEAILWLLDSNQALKESEFALLESIPEAPLRVLLVINKIDRLGEPGERDDAVAEILEYLDENVGDQVLSIHAISALEALQARVDEAAAPEEFEALQQFLDEQFVQRSWEIKIVEVSRALDELLDDIAILRTEQMSIFDELIEQARELGRWLEEAALEPTHRAGERSLELADRFDFVLLGIEREIDAALRRRGRILKKLVLHEDDRAFVLELLKERLDGVIDGCRRDILVEVDRLEAELARRLSPLLGALPVTQARPLRRRLEGFLDETRTLKTVLQERVFGQWRAEGQGRLATGADQAIDEIIALGEEADAEARRALLRALIPAADDRFAASLAAWYGEFFLAAQRFCARVQRDLVTLRLEVDHRFDFSTTTTH